MKSAQSGDYTAAAAESSAWIDALKRRPLSPQRRLLLSTLYLKNAEYLLHLKQRKKALTQLEKLAAMPSDAIPTILTLKLRTIFYTLARQLFQKRRLVEAIHFAKAAHRLAIEKTPSDSLAIMQTALRLSEIYFASGRYYEAFDLTKAVLDRLKKEHTGSQETLMTLQANLGVYAYRMGHYQRAERHLKRALDLSPDPNERAKILNTMALLYMEQAKYDLAERVLKDIAKLIKNSSLSLSVRFNFANEYGMLNASIGDMKYAKDYYLRAVSLAQKEKNRSYLRAAYANLGTLYQNLEKNEMARSYFKKALALCDKTDRLERATILSNLGLLHLNQGKMPTARRELNDALALKTQIFGAQSTSLVQTLLNLAQTYQANDPAKALSLERDALGLLRRHRDASDFLYFRSYYALAQSYALLGDKKRSYQAIFRAVDFFEKIENRVLTLGSFRQDLGFKESYREFIDHYLQTAYDYSISLGPLKRERVAKETLEHWINLKARVLGEAERIALIAHRSKNAQIKKRLTHLKELQQRLAKLYRRRLYGRELRPQEEAQVQRLTRQLESIEKELSSRLGIQPKEKATLTQVMQRLTPGERYLDFARVSDGYFLFEFDASGRCAFKRFDRASSKAIDRIVQQIYRENLAIGDQKTFADIKKARTAYGRLWEILDPQIELESGKSLAISPDGALRLLAFEALYDTKSHHFLIEEMPVLYYASGRRLLERHASAKSGNLSVAVFADPKYRVKKKKASPERGLFSAKLKGAFAPLPGSLREAEMIKRLFPTARLFLEENATKKALLSLPRVDILHLATHGFFLQPRSSLPLLLRSGLVLTGSDPNGTERILTSLEAAGMDLHRTDLVVLSACYSAVGEDIGGEGMIGLYEGFKLAGAQRILQSLWGVEDRLAVRLMHGFYQRIKAGDSYAAALRKAKLSLIRQGFDHPFYWAGWRLYGK